MTEAVQETRAPQSRWASWLPLLWIAGSMTFSLRVFQLPPALQLGLSLVFGLCFLLAMVVDTRAAIETKDWWRRTVLIWALLFFTPLVLPQLRHPELLPWLIENQFRGAASANGPQLVSYWKEEAGNNERVSTYLPTGKSYLVGVGIQKIYDPCRLDADGWNAAGVMRVSRGQDYEFATVRGLLGSGSYAALGQAHGAYPVMDFDFLLPVRGWKTLWLDANRMAVACTREQCGLLTGAKLDHFQPLGADRILDSPVPVREVVFHRQDGWYVLTLGWWQSVRGPIASEDLVSLDSVLSIPARSEAH